MSADAIARSRASRRRGVLVYDSAADLEAAKRELPAHDSRRPAMGVVECWGDDWSLLLVRTDVW